MLSQYVAQAEFPYVAGGVLIGKMTGEKNSRIS